MLIEKDFIYRKSLKKRFLFKYITRITTLTLFVYIKQFLSIFIFAS